MLCPAATETNVFTGATSASQAETAARRLRSSERSEVVNRQAQQEANAPESN